MDHKKQSYENLAETIIEKFNTRGIEGYYCDTRENAIAVIQRLLTPGCSVSWGGSMTIEELGIPQLLMESDCVVYDRAAPKTPEERKEMKGNIETCDYFFMSSNAITLDGQLVNIDGTGGRVSKLIYGPENVIVVAGMNKVTTDVQAAIDRVQNFAAPPNNIRLNRNTPCAQTGRCHSCLSDDCICCNIVITRKSPIPNRIKVVLIGEELGY
ncbi:MAG: lactate utilization protein [Lachnospiraceae bacterium]|nr:lactate utilization protein [Lachnospiraceae bacterium]